MTPYNRGAHHRTRKTTMLRCYLVATLVAAVVSPSPAQETEGVEPVPPTPAVEEVAPASPARRPGPLGPGAPRFTVRPGYRVTLASKSGLVHDAGFMAAGPKRSLFVVERARSAITLLRDEDRDGVYESAVTFIENRPGIHAVQYHRGWLYFSTPNAIERARDTDGDLLADDVETVVEGLPGGDGQHDARAVLVTRNFLFTALGDSGTGADETLTDRQKIWRFSLDGGGRTLWATGIRDTRKLQVRPGTSELWGIDSASDASPPREGATTTLPLPGISPPDEFNRYDLGGFYGHPFITAPRTPRHEFSQREDILELSAKTVPPQWIFTEHAAANGWAFLSQLNAHFPTDHRGDAFVACGGSGNENEQVGYRIERVLLDKWTGTPYGSQLIVGTVGGNGGRQILARPVDVVEAAGGSLLFSSDAPEPLIYRIEWTAAVNHNDAQPTSPDATQEAGLSEE